MPTSTLKKVKKPGTGYYIDTHTGKVRISNDGTPKKPDWKVRWVSASGALNFGPPFKRLKDAVDWVNEGWRHL